MESPASTFRNARSLPNFTMGYQEKPSPLQIPELLVRIGGYMDRSTLLSSQLVCRDWHQTLGFLVWAADMKLVQHGCQFKDPMTDDFIRQYATYVQRLSIQVDQRKYQYEHGNLDESLCLRSIVFPSLTLLEIEIPRAIYLNNEAREIEFVTSELFRLMLKSSSLGSGGGQGFRTLQVLKLRNLHFRYMPRDWMTLWETLWSRLQVLLLEGTWWHSYQIFEEEKGLDSMSTDSKEKRDERSDEMCDFSKMEELSRRLGPSLTMRDLTLIGNSLKNRVMFDIKKWMVLQCPKLTRLEWSINWIGRGEKSPLLLIRDAIVNGRQQDPPQFQDLEAVVLHGHRHKDDEFALLIEAMPRMTELNVEGTMEFTNWSWYLLTTLTPRHLQTLRSVNLEQCDLDSIILVDVLCSLPALEVFRGEYIMDKDLLQDPRPWACKGTLKHLCLDFKVTSKRRLFSQTMIIGRLAELEQLEDLMLTNSHLRLDMSEPDGVLGGLQSLRRMRSFTARTRNSGFFDYDWGLTEVSWARENWPELKYVDLVYYKDEVPEEDRFPTTPCYMVD